MNYLTLLLLIGLISSCANNPIKDLFAKNSTVEKQSGSPSENAPSESVEFDEETGETFEKEQKEIEKIVGSSSITKKNAHKRGTFFLYGAEHLELENNYFDFPVKYNKQVKRWIHYFTGKGRKHFFGMQSAPEDMHQ